MTALASADVTLTMAAMTAQLSDEDTSLRYYAAWWLGKFGSDGTPSERAIAVEALIGALGDESDRTALGGYPLRRNAARALGKLGDLRAVEPLIHSLDCDDYYVREAAAQSLGKLADPQGIMPLLGLLAGGVGVAQFVPGRPHLVQPYEAILESLGQLGAAQAIAEIEPFLGHDCERIEFAAARALYQLTGNNIYGERLLPALRAEDVQLRRSALLDLGAMGYIPGAEAIAQAPVENSFKLIALRGLVQTAIAESGEITPRVITLFTLMDGLL